MGRTQHESTEVLGVPSEFHVLNPRDGGMHEGASYFVVDADRGPAEPQLAALQRSPGWAWKG